MDNEQNLTHTLTHRTITETKWFCVDKDRCNTLDQMIASTNEHLGQLNTLVAEKWFGDHSGLECKTRFAKLTCMLADLKKERASLWRRGKREVEETVDETTGTIIARKGKTVAPHRVNEGPVAIPAILEGDPLVRIRHV